MSHFGVEFGAEIDARLAGPKMKRSTTYKRGLRSAWLSHRPNWLGLRHGQLGLRPGWLGRRPGWLGRRPGRLDLRPDWLGWLG